MPRPRLAPRLYLARSTGRPASWVIRDGRRFIRTGCAEEEQEKALGCLQTYGSAWVVPERRFAQHSPFRPNTNPTIYFVSCDLPDCPIKIGWAGILSERIAQIQAHVPHQVVVLATKPGAVRDERALHRRFAALRLHGEWFRRGPELLEQIEEINALRDHIARVQRDTDEFKAPRRSR